MGAFQLTEGAVPIILPGGSQRLLAFLALKGRRLTRAAAAGTLWPEVTDHQAQANLRSAIWRLDQITRDAMHVELLDLQLAPSVSIDYEESRALAHRLLVVDTEPAETDLAAATITALSVDLLPDWYDDWAIIEAEDWHQLRLHALEALSRQLTTVGRCGEAIDAARAAIAADPLRESSQVVLIHAHLAEGNQSEALRAFAAYRTLLTRELGLEPTSQLSALVEGLHIR